jgi:hypothetical protein
MLERLPCIGMAVHKCCIESRSVLKHVTIELHTLIVITLVQQM